MPKAKIIIVPNAIVGEIAFDLTQIYVTGDFQFPVLSIPLEIGLLAGVSDNQTKQQAVRPISLIRISGELGSPPHRVVARFQEDVGLLGSHPHRATTMHYRLEIPLDLTTVTRIEESRSGDLACALTLRPLLAVHNTELNNGGAQFFCVARVDNLAFTIPRSQWVDLLPRLGYGGLELLEVRYGSGVNAFQLPKSVAEIQLAKKALVENDWDKAVSHCRRAVEVILDSRPSSLPPQTQFRVRVETFLSDHLKNLEDRQARLLSEQMRMIWEVASQSIHANPIPPCKKPDAEFLVRATMALLEYFSKLLS